MKPKFFLAVALACLAGPALAQDVKVHPYPSQANYCPMGLQPVSVGGVISCGTPNVAESEFAWNRHPAQPLRGAQRDRGALSQGWPAASDR